MDELSDLLERFPLRAGVFYTGAMCGTYDFPRDVKPGHFHLVRSGRLELLGDGHDPQGIDRPSVVFMPDGGTHRFVADPGVDILCATVRFGSGDAGPVVRALPSLVVLPLAEAPPLMALCDAMFEEAGSNRPGRQATLNRLCELGVIAALRSCIDSERISSGLLAGLADPRLSRAMVAMHEQPAREWSLAELAALATMSRARFAAQFRTVVGQTPGDHLAARRVQEAQRLLRSGLSLKQVADRVGYGSASALTRAFTRVVGVAPSHWRVGPRPVP
ncbi:MAG TPA: AraC family transcriptional regulator [Caldimonas sp.]|nr:AraC family transcriptional regulator [Caldimonas sp.]